MSDLLILPEWLIRSARETPLKGWGIHIRGSVINDVAPHGTLTEKYPDAERWTATSQVLSPGFVDCHSHLYGVLAHGMPLSQAPDGFWPFLQDFWWPLVEDRLDKSMILAATKLRCVTMARGGITSFYDCTEAPNALPGILSAQAEIVRESGLRGILSFEATERVSRQNAQLGLRENAEFVKDSRSAGGLVSGLMCFHTSFTCSAALIRQAVEMANDLDVTVQFHCAEGVYEQEFALKHFGKRAIHYYNDLGLADSRMLASQCVHVDDGEIDLMGALGMRAAHLPLSNCEVGGGIAPVPRLLDAGVCVGLGTDGYIDDVFDVMRGAFLIHKAQLQDARVMPAHTVWHMATEGAAQALGLEKVGRLEPGWKADAVLVDANLPTPLHPSNLLEQLILYRSRSDVRATLVAGRQLMRDGYVLNADVEELTEHTREAAARLWRRPY